MVATHKKESDMRTLLAFLSTLALILVGASASSSTTLQTRMHAASTGLVYSAQTEPQP